VRFGQETATAAAESQVATVLNQTFSKSGIIHVFTSGKRIQQSGLAGATTSALSDRNPIPLAVKMPDGAGGFYYRLFKIEKR
jgi:hypothetical protein